MKKIFILGFTILCFGISGHAETKIADLDKLVAEGKGKKEAEGVYTLRDRVVINGKEFSKTEYGGLYSSRNLEYFLFNDFDPKIRHIAKLFDKKGNLLWDLKKPGEISRAIISDKGIVALFYGEIGTTSVLQIIGKNGQKIKTIQAGDPFDDDNIGNLYEDHAQFAKNSDMLFVLAYFQAKQLVLLGLDETGEVKYFEKVNPSIKDIDDWYARVYFNPRLKQVLIDSSGIGETPPMLTYWSFPQKEIFSKKTNKDEVIVNAAFGDNDDILLRVKKRDGAKTIRRLGPDGKEKYNKSEINKMDARERGLIGEKLLDVRSLNWGRE